MTFRARLLIIVVRIYLPNALYTYILYGSNVVYIIMYISWFII